VWAAIPAAFMLLLPSIAAAYDAAACLGGAIGLAVLLAAPLGALAVTFYMVGAIAQTLPEREPASKS
jgi:hypothetical protein